MPGWKVWSFSQTVQAQTPLKTRWCGPNAILPGWHHSWIVECNPPRSNPWPEFVFVLALEKTVPIEHGCRPEAGWGLCLLSASQMTTVKIVIAKVYPRTGNPFRLRGSPVDSRRANETLVSSPLRVSGLLIHYRAMLKPTLLLGNVINFHHTFIQKVAFTFNIERFIWKRWLW